MASPGGVIVDLLHSDLEVSEFELELRYDVRYRVRTPYPSSFGLNRITVVLIDGPGIK